MSSENSDKSENTPAKFAKYASIAVFIVILLIAINVHLQNPVLVFGGGTAIVVAVLAHVGVFAGLMKTISTWRGKQE